MNKANIVSFETPNNTSRMTVDEQGKVRLPTTLCEHMGIYTGDQFEAIIHEGRIILARHTPTCFACGDDCDVQKLYRTFLCGVCRDVLRANMGVIHLREIDCANGLDSFEGGICNEKYEAYTGISDISDISETKNLSEAAKSILKERGWGLL